MSTTVTVTSVEPAPGSTVWTAEGITEDGQPIRFAGDWRPMMHVDEAIESGEEVVVEVEDWQVLG